jgi:SAM-dependent methyltransferase
VSEREPARRRALGAWYTPEPLVARLADWLTDGVGVRADGRPVRVVDPACGDGRLLSAVADRLGAAGVAVEAIGCDVDPAALAAVRDPRIRCVTGDALTLDWGALGLGDADLVIGNPPFLSQMASATTRGAASRRGGGPYADTAMEFCCLAVELCRDGGRVALVLPQSVLAARDAGPLRAAVERRARPVWWWWEPGRHVDAQVHVCLAGFAVGRAGCSPAGPDGPLWNRVISERLGVPALPAFVAAGTIGDRARAGANFRDEYYALVPAVDDGGTGPPLVTSGLIDPGVCRWGAAPVRFAGRRIARPTVALERLEGRFAAWADRLLVPKVLVAAQTRVIEAVADPGGDWIPGVPVISVVPDPGVSPSTVASVLTCPLTSAVAWWERAGTGLSAGALRLSPSSVLSLPWPAGDLTAAEEALGAGDVIGCGRATLDAFGVGGAVAEELLDWWSALLPTAGRRV